MLHLERSPRSYSYNENPKTRIRLHGITPRIHGITAPMHGIAYGQPELCWRCTSHQKRAGNFSTVLDDFTFRATTTPIPCAFLGPRCNVLVTPMLACPDVLTLRATITFR